MKITKSNWVADEHSVHLAMPIAKVDAENRLVSGFATLDNLDQHGDVVTAEASAKAFARARGNLREMHQPIAAGHLVDFREDEFYDPGTSKFYRGVYVTAYVSKGAEDTWQKVLDGTLSGFSIGGNITEQESEWVKDAGRTVRFIKDYDLIELSLVDNPANQLANVFSIQKMADNSVMIKGMIAETTFYNVFYCDTDEIAKRSTSDSENCAQCGIEMRNIGWFEGGDNDAEKVTELVGKAVGVSNEGTPETSKGGVDVAKEDEKVAAGEETVEETVHPDNAEVTPEVQEAEANVSEDAEEAPAEQEAVVDEGADAAVVDEANTDEPDLEKMISDLNEAVRSSLEKAETTTTEAVAKIEEQVGEVRKSFEDKASELNNKIDELSKGLDALKETSGEVAKRLEVLEDETAVKKSGDNSSETVVTKAVKKTDWKGAFLGDLER